MVSVVFQFWKSHCLIQAQFKLKMQKANNERLQSFADEKLTAKTQVVPLCVTGSDMPLC